MNLKRRAAALMIAGALCVPFTASAAGTDELWEISNQMSMPGVPPGMGSTTHQVCQDKDPAKQTVQGQDMEKCKITDRKQSGTRMSVTVTCPDGKGGPSVTREPVVPGGPAVPGTDGPSTGAMPQDGTFASVTANGTGCPAGTWNTAISSDGRTFTTTFTSYSAFVSPEQAISIKDCTLQIKVHTSEFLQYAVQGLEFLGYSYLEEGVTATVTAKTYFQGNPSDSVDTSSELKGYTNDLFVLKHGVDLGREAWSECGKERQINVQTRIRLRNADPAGTGFVNLSAAKGRAQVIVRGSARRCSPDTSTPSTPDVSAEREPTPSTPAAPGISVERS